MKNKKLRIAIFCSLALVSILALVSCSSNSNKEPTDTIVQEQASEDSIASRVNFSKKYYYLDYDGVVKEQYYTINQDGTASYTHIMKTGENVTFHQQINFKWTYSGEGNCILVHNGTKMIKGEQDDAFGISRVMHVGKDVMFWSASGENTYYICEDYTAQIPDYAKLVN